MSDWKKQEIKEIYYMMDMESKNAKLERAVKIHQNPTVEQIWFYYIDQKKTELLQQMIDEKVVDINVKSSDGDSIVHMAINKKSKKLIDFCIKNNADFYKVSTYDEETGFYEVVYGYVGINTFKKVWSLINKDKVMEQILKPNCTRVTFIEKLVSDDRNIAKLIWIEKEFQEEWENIKADKKLWSELEYAAIENDAQGVVLFLKGLQKLKNQLETTLIAKEETVKRLKL